jgi:hypothetical protein
MQTIYFLFLFFACIYQALNATPVAKPIETISCFLNLEGSCNSALSFDSNKMRIYMDEYNSYVKKYNFNNPTKFFLPTQMDTILKMPCDGDYYSFTNNCDHPEIFVAQDLCRIANMNKSSTTELYIIFNLPSKSCNKVWGFATTASEPWNAVWIQSSRLFDPSKVTTLVHEMGHTKGLNHSGAYYFTTWDYADCSCPMGCAQSIEISYNPPNAYLLGWAEPITVSVLYNNWSYVDLALYASRKKNHIMLENKQKDCKLFFSVRSSIIEPGLVNIGNVNSNGMYVFIDGSLSIHTLEDRSMFVDAIPVESTWSGLYCGMNITVSFISFDYTTLISKIGLLRHYHDI